MKNLYYIAPPENVFAELKNICIEIWNTYDNEYGYAEEKIGRIKDILNIDDNFMCMLAMFDFINQSKVINKLSEETKKEVRERLIAGGAPESYLINIGL